MRVEEMMARNNEDDIIEIGNIVELGIKGQFGKVLKAVVEGTIRQYAKDARDNAILTADRALGRIDALDLLLEKLDECVGERNKILQYRAEEVRDGKEEAQSGEVGSQKKLV